MKGPIIVGGIGGSGTRLVAGLLKELNVFIGNDLNPPLDNLTFTLIFKRQKWFFKNKDNTREINRGIRILEKAMTNRKPYSVKEYWFLLKATVMMYRHGHYNNSQGKGFWAIKRLKHILFKRTNMNLTGWEAWGWKESNSHLILGELSDYFPDMKYIHTIRHGLDMAYSTTQQQLFNWAPLFEINIPRTKEEIPFSSFRYWVEVNKKVLGTGQKLGEDKFYCLNYDELCKNPKEEIEKLLLFLQIPFNDKLITKLATLPKIPKSFGRFRDHNNSIFLKEDIEYLEKLGFSSK